MATVQITVCDECGQHKNDANHWFVVCSPRWKGGVDMLKMSDMSSGSDVFPLAHLCGQKCAMTVFQRWMDTGSIDKIQVEHPATITVEQD